MRLDVILRTCGKQGVLGSDVMRICGNNRKELIFKCITSLVSSLNQFSTEFPNVETCLYVLDDHSSPEFLTSVNAILDKLVSPYSIINLTEDGFNHSAYEQFRYGRDIATDLVYFVEDDYLHAPDAITSMVTAYQYFRSKIDPVTDVCIYPYDSTHNYDENVLPPPTRLFYDGTRLWRTTNKTANTMLIDSRVVRNFFPLFEELALHYKYGGQVNEDNTINRLYNNFVTYGGPVTLFSPIPSTAIHVSFAEPIKLTSTLNDWRMFYNSVDISDET